MLFSFQNEKRHQAAEPPPALSGARALGDIRTSCKSAGGCCPWQAMQIKSALKGHKEESRSVSPWYMRQHLCRWRNLTKAFTELALENSWAQRSVTPVISAGAKHHRLLPRTTVKIQVANHSPCKQSWDTLSCWMLQSVHLFHIDPNTHLLV